MQDEIKKCLDDPQKLEKLYHSNRAEFKQGFNTVFHEIKENLTAKVWNERLNFENDSISWGTGKELIFIIIASVIASIVAKIPEVISIEEEFYYTRNISFIFFPMLIAYFSWKRDSGTIQRIIISAIILVSALYINMLPDNNKSDTLILASIHLPLLIWAVLGFTFIGGNLKNYNTRIDFLRYNGDLLVMTTIIVIAGAIFTGITFGLFSLIDQKTSEIYIKIVAVCGLAFSPIIGTYIIQQNPQLINKVSPVIAKVFTPFVILTLVIYLIAVIASDKNPYSDREFLLIFNILLVGVMAIILFSLAEVTKSSVSKISNTLLFVLSILTIIVNTIALSAIIFRISEWGITPNRLAVLGSNVLILTNLLLVTHKLYKTITGKCEIESAEKSISSFLPIYVLWIIIVIFVFPVLFSFK